MFPISEFKVVPIPFVEEIWWNFILHMYKRALVPPTIEEPCRWVGVSYFVTNPYGDGLSSPSFLASPQSHTPMYKAKRLSNGKCNMMLSCDKSLCNVLNCWIAFMTHKNAQVHFTRVRLNVMRHWWHTKSGPPPHKSSRLSRDWFWLLWYFNFLKCAYVPPQLVCLECFCMDGIKLYDT